MFFYTLIKYIITLCGVGAIVGFMFALIPSCVFDIKGWRKIFKFEKNGAFYEYYLKITLWKDLIPQFSKMFHFGYKKDKIPVKDLTHYETFVVETIRAEITHILLIIFSPLYYTAIPFGWATFAVVASVIANTPCIAIQRYNRIRIMKIISRLEKKFQKSSEEMEEN
ncbi:MAG: hypothetical protein J6A69_08150 [Clostridia bacterium]|nr:hypothetical protein [Clostridia bacterium]